DFRQASYFALGKNKTLLCEPGEKRILTSITKLSHLKVGLFGSRKCYSLYGFRQSEFIYY
uniref:Uncharacterized protein n=1 Tax=Aegilops tauschii subsp. strangulata TaxID=200361 RepID=A0A453DLL3_AEGTS